MAEVCLTVGVPASGKSTWARQQIAAGGYDAIVCRDDIRLMQGLKHGEDENLVTMVERALIEGLILEDKTIIVADTNINAKFRKQLIKFCHEHGADVVIKTFPIALDQAILWDAMRDAQVGAQVIVRMYNDLQGQDLRDEFLPVKSFEPYAHNYDDKREEAVVFDLDGTLARHHNRSPYEEDKVKDDEPIVDVVDIAVALADKFTILFVSGRTDGCFDDTADWIYQHTGLEVKPYVTKDAELHMRRKGDVRPDWEVKNEIYDREIIPRYNIRMVFDDRDQVVRHLRRRGITVAQVAPGRF